MTMIACLSILGTSCQSASRPVDVRIDALVSIDGKLKLATAFWQLKVSDTFPQGAVIGVKGTALIIPVTSRLNIYGLFRTLQGNELVDWSIVPAVLNAFVREEDYKSGRTKWAPTSPGKFIDYAVNRLSGRRVPLCQPVTERSRLNSTCPALIYFRDIRDPNTAVRITPGRLFKLNGHTAVIKSITATYDIFPHKRKDNNILLPKFVDVKVNETYAPFPDSSNIQDGMFLKTDDFWRDQ